MLKYISKKASFHYLFCQFYINDHASGNVYLVFFLMLLFLSLFFICWKSVRFNWKSTILTRENMQNRSNNIIYLC